ncbi:MAG: stage II sporulation protein M [Spirochaetia bacterium]|nr:stage II sporulation protein M [Spirochaetia bacterium]
MQQRSPDWDELTRLLPGLEHKRKSSVADLLKFARLYRACCTDLSLASAFRLSRPEQHRLEELVARGHSVLYSIPRRTFRDVAHFIFSIVPQAIRRDIFVRICVPLFYGSFLICGGISYYSKPFAENVAGAAVLESYREMHEGGHDTVTLGDMVGASGFYIANNVGLNLLTFGLGALLGIGSLFFCLYNGIFLGTIIGHLLTTPARDNILSWVVAHAPFELTAIGFSAAAGMRIGFALVTPGARTYLLAVREEAIASLPALFSAAMLTFFAAFIEAFLGPLHADMKLKIGIGSASALLMISYFFLGGRK